MKQFVKQLIIKNKLLNRIYVNLNHFFYSINYLFYFKKANPCIDYEKIDKVMFIAHPDDEIVSMGNFLFNNLDRLLVVCMTNGGNKTRLKEFSSLMNDLNIQYKILNFKDGLDFKWNEKKILKKIESILDHKKDWKMVLSHNREGDYGHFQHKEVNRLVRSVYRGENLYVPVEKGTLICNKYQLTIEEAEYKLRIFKRYYPSQQHIVDLYRDYFMYESIRNERENCDD